MKSIRKFLSPNSRRADAKRRKQHKYHTMLGVVQPILQRQNSANPRNTLKGSPVESSCEKPPLSYQTLIARAIMSSGGALPLAGIYSFIMETSPYFRTTSDNWRNRVRHTLTVCKCFKRGLSASSRRGGLWTIDAEFRYCVAYITNLPLGGDRAIPLTLTLFKVLFYRGLDIYWNWPSCHPTQAHHSSIDIPIPTTGLHPLMPYHA